ncbi:hypothetical protein FIV42_00690 [Persicimonas caeni]|uniref:Uncharacterized protein n=1 Tax=Persicimonas caeni TaxID=2292766 RepID=A0A4Y6PLY0_PERCE|nr:hypothetical protein [Persicimonas caeni]QDG49301.1 hypothetical protein FIV42_00690 [Persicimonas caeni]QED30522.1 hypothetical protein FRD00_00685 [Persicimonas caeni]
MLEVRIGAGTEDAFARLLGVTNDLHIERVWPDLATEVVHPFMLAHSKKQFATEGRHGGRPWADYSQEPLYAAYKLMKVGHLDLLRWQKGGTFEQLYPSLTDPNHDLHIFRVGRTSVSIGSAVDHAYSLTTDTEGPFGEPSPGRDVLAMRPTHGKRLTTNMQRRLKQRLARRGLRIGDVRSNL